MNNWIGLGTFVRREIQRTFRVGIQTIVTPLITALLYIFVFGSVVGSRIDLINGVPYIKFVLPGILMMNVIMSAFGSASSSVYFKRFIRDIEEILVAPFSYLEMVLGFIAGAVSRAVIVGAGIYLVAIFFTGASISHIGLLFWYVLSVSIVFALLGIIVGLWANGFEQLNVLNTFIITPLSFLGGMFYSLSMLPEGMRTVVLFNPFFYFMDGIRFAMIGVQESDPLIGNAIIIGLIVILTVIVWRLFASGWRIRE